ncbi:MAG: chromosome segregation protein SMC [Gammaproteobacteria bacterium]|nr:chromosome segregation protein SMC [Gammaproteobacteria bacterium]
MRLSKIKLAGFKSFVDPISLSFPDDLTGIVGPNGCGKSNIIDAVLWVLGESSAKHLRGDALADVIFNGSASRQPVGQASVELVFDNADGSLGGQYASYDEISIKRQINRESISVYYLNGTRCRRRDITNIFLGTGLGPRSYAIVEQGMISRLIEAKPEELRFFIEEAAGISKYRERRRETENRMHNTRDNIIRLNDIRDELDKQLRHLKQQARAAKRYQVRKQEERKLKAELLALRWRLLQRHEASEEQEIQKQEAAMEGLVAALRAVEADIEKHREMLGTAMDSFNDVQASFYRVGADISRLEQSIQHAKERGASMQRDLSQVERNLAEAGEQHTIDQGQLDTLSDRVAELEPVLERLHQEEEDTYEQFTQAEQHVHTWQAEWDEFNQRASESHRDEQVEGTRLAHLEMSSQDVRHRIAALQEEYDSIVLGPIEQARKALTSEISKIKALQSRLTAKLETKHAELKAAREHSDALAIQLDEARSHQQALNGKLLSLEVLQQSALGEQPGIVVEWLNQTGLSDAPRLAGQISVESGWERAVETVLGFHLQDICVHELGQVVHNLNDLAEGSLGLFDPHASEAASYAEQLDAPRLRDHVKAPWAMGELLSGIYAVQHLDAALALQPRLRNAESVITKDGIWLGKSWVRLARAQDERAGTLSRDHKIKRIKSELASLDREVTGLAASLEKSRSDHRRLEQERDAVQAELQARQEGFTNLRSELAAKEEQYAQARTRIHRIDDELGGLKAQERADHSELDAVQARLDAAQTDVESLKDERVRLTRLKDQHYDALHQARARWQATRDKSHEIALQLESTRSQRSSLELALNRHGALIAQLTARRDDLLIALGQSDPPLHELHQQLDRTLNEKVRVENELSGARTRVESLEADIRELEQRRVACEQEIQEFRGQLDQVRLARQTTRGRMQTLREQFDSSGFQFEDVLSALPEEIDEAALQEELNTVNRKIDRLGAINLAAIDEFSQLSERKTYLDRQHNDLHEALSTLESAIRKIDRETRTRFKETYDKLNTNLQSTFPRLFGGGHAYLELTGDDLLETGVTVMARPPGKRNTTIHLLSGGEKALTAVALVFAIFELNPAPLCILDEVDAPLDDTNVGRYCDLVKSMSDRVQIVLVTHNEITMEIVEQLIGVTMQEAGVSRLVAVDMEQAVGLATATA